MTDAAAVRVAALAALLGEKTRASMCLHLLDGRAWTAGELAKATGVGAATASEHLDRLVSGGLLAEERQGRHRYVRLAGPEAAALVEQLAAASGPVPAPTGYSGVRAGERLAKARTCYDHLAGRLGVGLLDGMERAGHLDRGGGVAFTRSGIRWLEGLDIDVVALNALKRPMTRLCLDWTERRHHLAGSAAAAVCTAFVQRGWIERGASRLVLVTDAGRANLRRQLGLSLD